MSAGQYFLAGAKLIGLYYLIWGLISLVSAILFMPKAGQAMIGMGYSYAPLLIIPVVLMFLSIYLMKGRQFVRLIEFDSDEGEEEETKLGNLFTVFVKLFGIYLIIGNLTGFASDLANYLWVIGDASPYESRAAVAELFGRRTNILPTVMSMLFGVLLLCRGELLAYWAFKRKEQ